MNLGIQLADKLKADLTRADNQAFLALVLGIHAMAAMAKLMNVSGFSGRAEFKAVHARLEKARGCQARAEYRREHARKTLQIVQAARFQARLAR